MKIRVIENGELLQTQEFDDKHYGNGILGWYGRSLVDTFSASELKELSAEDDEEKVFECGREIFDEFRNRVLALEKSEMMMKRVQSLSTYAAECLYMFVSDNQYGSNFWERLANRHYAICQFLAEIAEEAGQQKLN